jgi:NAD(P)-dependent dehydrogenase (short-subunit alcohol dehydrogenase family)
MSAILVTNVRQYTGPGVIGALLKESCHVVCHDGTFTDAKARADFMAEYPGTSALAAMTPEGIFAELGTLAGEIDGIVSNDVYPITKNAIEDIPLDDLRATFEAVLVFPFRLTQLFLPGMKQRRRGSIVFVTSARESRPEPGFAVPTSIRAGTTGFAKAVAKEVAPFGIQVNVVGPNYLYSEMYYPRARFVDNPTGRQLIAQTVPMARLGTPEEVGALIGFLVSGRSAFTTGQVIYFAGGWP